MMVIHNDGGNDGNDGDNVGGDGSGHYDSKRHRIYRLYLFQPWHEP
jgi:hypothetical protein